MKRFFDESPAGYAHRTVCLLAISLIVRAVAAALIGLGNDEVYYWTYALFPDFSHFDHPPMVGWLMQLCTFNLACDSPFALRLEALLLGTLNTWIIYCLGRLIKNERTGWYAALLYTASIYASVLCGTFIMPDAPLATCWLSALLFLVKAVNGQPRHFLGFGVFAGLAMLSKYTGVFLWGGAFLYVLFYDRRLFKSPYFWVGGCLSLVLFSPVIYWNIVHSQNGISYHSERVNMAASGLSLRYFARELLGEAAYQNPINFVLMAVTVWQCRKPAPKGRKAKAGWINTPCKRLLLCTALPLWGVFLFISLFRATLPHWSGPAFFSLMLLVAARIEDEASSRATNHRLRKSLQASMVLVAAVFVGGVAEIQTGIIPMGTAASRQENAPNLGQFDFTMDMYGWDQVHEHFTEIIQPYSKQMQQAPLLCHRWFPAAHLDYYVARPNGTVVKTYGPLEQTHKYESITQKRGGYNPKQGAWILVSSRYPNTPLPSNALPIDSFTVERRHRIVARWDVYVVPPEEL